MSGTSFNLQDMDESPPRQEQPATEVGQQELHVTREHFRVWPIIRDIVIILALSGAGGIVVGVAAGRLSWDEQRTMLAVAVSDLLLRTVGFTISGCLARGRRWRHLACVAVGVWLADHMNVLLFGQGIVQRILSAFSVAMAMDIGGGLSYAFKRGDRDPSAIGLSIAIPPIREVEPGTAQPQARQVPMRILYLMLGIIIHLCIGNLWAWDVFRIPLQKAYGWTVFEAASPFLLSGVTFAVGMLVGGRWQDKAGPRPVAVTGGILLGAGFILSSFLGSTLAGLYLSGHGHKYDDVL